MKPIQLFDIKTRTLGFAFLSTPKKVLTKISHPKKVTTKFQTQKKSSDRKFQTQKRASHIPVAYLPEYPPAPPPPPREDSNSLASFSHIYFFPRLKWLGRYKMLSIKFYFLKEKIVSLYAETNYNWHDLIYLTTLICIKCM